MTKLNKIKTFLEEKGWKYYSHDDTWLYYQAPPNVGSELFWFIPKEEDSEGAKAHIERNLLPNIASAYGFTEKELQGLFAGDGSLLSFRVLGEDTIGGKLSLAKVQRTLKRTDNLIKEVAVLNNIEDEAYAKNIDFLVPEEGSFIFNFKLPNMIPSSNSSSGYQESQIVSEKLFDILTLAIDTVMKVEDGVASDIEILYNQHGTQLTPKLLAKLKSFFGREEGFDGIEVNLLDNKGYKRKAIASHITGDMRSRLDAFVEYSLNVQNSYFKMSVEVTSWNEEKHSIKVRPLPPYEDFKIPSAIKLEPDVYKRLRTSQGKEIFIKGHTEVRNGKLKFTNIESIEPITSSP